MKMYNKKDVPNNNDDKETPVPQNNLTAGKNTENKPGLYNIIYQLGLGIWRLNSNEM